MLVVDKTVELPTEAIPNRAARQFACNWGQNGLPATSSDAFQNNLQDTRGNHQRTYFSPHKVIVGVAAPSPEALTQLQTSFVPLGVVGADGTPDVVSLSSLDLSSDWSAVRDDVAAAIWPRRNHARKSGRIAEIAWDTAQCIAKAVIAKSGDGQPGLRGFVAVPPLQIPSTLRAGKACGSRMAV